MEYSINVAINGIDLGIGWDEKTAVGSSASLLLEDRKTYASNLPALPHGREENLEWSGLQNPGKWQMFSLGFFVAQ